MIDDEIVKEEAGSLPIKEDIQEVPRVFVSNDELTNSRLDVASDFIVQKKVSIPLRLFGSDPSQRSFPPFLHIYGVVNGIVTDLGRIYLKYEDYGTGKNKLSVSNSSAITKYYKDHKIIGWSLIRDGAVAVMHLLPPAPGNRVGSNSWMSSSQEEDALAAAALKELGSRVLPASYGAQQEEDEEAEDAYEQEAEGEDGYQGSDDGQLLDGRHGHQLQQGHASMRRGWASSGADDVEESSLDQDEHQHDMDQEQQHGLQHGIDGDVIGQEDADHLSFRFDRHKANYTEYDLDTAELLARKPDHLSNALLTNNNISVPLAMFGTNPFDRVMPDKIHLLVNFEARRIIDMGGFKVNVSKSQNGARMKVSLGATGTVHRRFPENTYMVGWSKVVEGIMMIYLRQGPPSSSSNQATTTAGINLATQESEKPEPVHDSRTISTPPPGYIATGVGAKRSFSVTDMIGAAALEASKRNRAVVDNGTVQAGLHAIHSAITSGMGATEVQRLQVPGGQHVTVTHGTSMDLGTCSAQPLTYALPGLPLVLDHQLPAIPLSRTISRSSQEVAGLGPNNRVASAARQQDTGLPKLPDLDSVPNGIAGISKYFLKVMTALGVPTDVKLRLMKFVMLPHNKERIDVVYTFLQDCCNGNDYEGAAQVLAEITGPVGIAGAE